MYTRLWIGVILWDFIKSSLKGAFTYDSRYFWCIYDLPTYPNQTLYYISLFSKIRFSLNQIAQIFVAFSEKLNFMVVRIKIFCPLLCAVHRIYLIMLLLVFKRFIFFCFFGILGMRTSIHVRAKLKHDFAVTKYLIVPKSLFM